jgi:hypothetical protein
MFVLCCREGSNVEMHCMRRDATNNTISVASWNHMPHTVKLKSFLEFQKRVQLKRFACRYA